MTNPLRSLRTRLLLSYLLVVGVGVVTLLIASSQLAPPFIQHHVDEMENFAGSLTEHEAILDFRDGVLSGFTQALLVAAFVSSVVAVIVAAVSSDRLLRPLDDIRRTTRRLASGSYTERVAEPAESELAALAADVNALAATLEETEQRRLHLISEVSHELRSPLATIKGYMEALVDGVLPMDEEVLVVVGKETSRLERLATDLNTLSRTEEGRDELRLELVDMAEIAQDVTAHLRPQFQDQEVALEAGSMARLPAEVDRDRMTQVLTNIIGNALTYTPANGKVRINGGVVGETVQIEVTDTGRGLEPDQLAIVFERFYRADRSVAGGSGIGLTIARSIALRHGGDITVSSPGPGLGSTFTITLPHART